MKTEEQYYLETIADYFEDELTMYVFFSPLIFERETKRYKKKFGVKYALGQTFLQFDKKCKEASPNDIQKYKKELFYIFIDDRAFSLPFFQYLTNVYLDEDNLEFDICERIRNRLHNMEMEDKEDED